MDRELDKIDLAWAAGFLDGEGCFTLLVPSGRQLHELTREVHVSAVQVRGRAHMMANQARRDPLDHLVSLFGGRIGRTSQTKTGHPIYQWRLTNAEDMRRAIPLLLPYFRVKRREAEIVLAFAQTVRRRGRTRKGECPYSDEEIATRTSLIEEMKEIRGRKVVI